MNKEQFANRIVGHGEVDPKSLTPNPNNYREHPDLQKNALNGSLEEIGWIQVITVNKTTGNMVDGHLRQKLALEKGEEKVPVVYVELTEEEEKKALLLLDPIAGLATENAKKLKEITDAVNMRDESLRGLIGDMMKRNKLFSDSNNDCGDEDNNNKEEPEERKKYNDDWGVEENQIWKLGDSHLLLCGDCYNKDVIHNFMGNKKVAIGFYDPPYGVDFQSNSRKKTEKFEKLDNDDRIITDWMQDAYSFLEDNGAMYVCTRWDVYPEWYKAVEKFSKVKNLIILHKSDSGLGDLKGDYAPSHELIMYITKGRHIIRGGRSSNIWQLGKVANNNDYVHPTQKKVEVPEYAIVNSSDAGDYVADWFVGSGTTIIASERTGRRCIAIEKNPEYCAVTLQRYKDYTGIQPTLVL